MRTATLSSGVVMRLFRIEEAPALFAAVNAERDRLGEWMPWVPHATGPGAFTAFIQGALRSDEEGTEFHRGLFARDQVIGGLGASVDLVNRVAEVGYWMISSFEGRGVMTEAVRNLVAFLFDDYEVHRIVIRAAVENTRSRAIAERLGFTPEGIQRESLILNETPTDAAVYSMLEQEWRPGS
ncbi:MAG: GNAT family protein [Actinomycetota bacterium]